jgi:hypothetical protein
MSEHADRTENIETSHGPPVKPEDKIVIRLTEQERHFWDKAYIAAAQSGASVDQAAHYGLCSVLARRTVFGAAGEADEKKLRGLGLITNITQLAPSVAAEIKKR